jgi:hypothetical protein
MVYTFLSSVFITLFMVLGSFAFYHYLKICLLDFSWATYRHIIVMTVLALLCLIFACLFGTQIPDCYVC